MKGHKTKQSILQDKQECYVTGRTDCLRKHHIYGGANRNISERNGFYIYLIPELHNMSDKGIHFDKEFNLDIKIKCQRKFEETHTRDEFLKLIGRSYL